MTTPILEERNMVNSLRMVFLTMVFPGGQGSTSIAINPDAVLWLMPAGKNAIGKSAIRLLGAEVVALEVSVDEAVKRLGLELVKLKSYDRAGRVEFNTDVFVSPALVSAIIKAPLNGFTTIKFNDGSVLDILDPELLENT